MRITSELENVHLCITSLAILLNKLEWSILTVATRIYGI
jgi:hypothetical protein